jgi:ribosomal protein S11
MIVNKNFSITPALTRGFYFGPFDERRVAAFHITVRRRNLFLTATDLTGAVLGAISAKTFAWDRKKRFAPHILELGAGKLVAILKVYRVTSIRLFLKISKKWVAGALARVFKSANIQLTLCMTSLPVPHNGCRRKKLRRL